MFLKLLHTEYLKSRHSSTIWFTLSAALLVPFFQFIRYVVRWEHNITPMELNPWTEFIDDSFIGIAPFLFPAYIIMLIALNAQLEHKNNTWKKLYTLPVKKWQIYLSKMTFLMLNAICALVLFTIASVLVVWLAALIHPEIGFTNHAPDVALILKRTSTLIVIVLGITAIQTFLSMISRKVMLPLGVGIFALILSAILVLTWKGSAYNPFAYPYYYMMDIQNLLEFNTLKNENLPYILSTVYFVVITGFSLFVFNRKRVKN